MSNPVVLITGALTDIGRATAIAFAKEGARLVVAAPLRRTARLNRQRHPVSLLRGVLYHRPDASGFDGGKSAV